MANATKQQLHELSRRIAEATARRIEEERQRKLATTAAAGEAPLQVAPGHYTGYAQPTVDRYARAKARVDDCRPKINAWLEAEKARFQAMMADSPEAAAARERAMAERTRLAEARAAKWAADVANDPFVGLDDEPPTVEGFSDDAITLLINTPPIVLDQWLRRGEEVGDAAA